MRNPWLGLSSYTEETLSYYQFNGRAAAVRTLTELIRRNLFVTLYGRSGVGKTSLLQAGVFPILRSEGMLPLSIRLNEVNDINIPASELLWKRLCGKLEKEDCHYINDKNDSYLPDFSEVLVLRKLFSSGRFINAKGSEVVPVIVLDQFEEFLYKSSKSSSLLVSQLYALIDDNVNLNIPHPTWHDDTNFRIVVSIREDDLFLFEDLIDRLNCEDFKSNRFRLMPLSDSEAMEVILNPTKNKKFFEEGQEYIIAQEIIKLCKSNRESINTLMLSLTCYILYNNFVLKNQYISLGSLVGYKDILDTYYLEAVKDLPKSQRFYLEDNLVDEQGRRISVYKEDLEKRAPKVINLIWDNENRLLNENQGRVELIHDQLAASIAKIKTKRRSRLTKRIGIISLIFGLLILFFVSFSYPNRKRINIAPVTTSKEYVYVQNSLNVKEYIVDNEDKYDCSQSYIISSCPNLRSIKINKSCAKIIVYNCPRLTTIDIPKNFYGVIDAYNCPNLPRNEQINFIKEFNDVKLQIPTGTHDSTRFYNYASEFGLLESLNSNPRSDTVYYLPTLYSPVVKRSIIFNDIITDHKGVIGQSTGVSDSLKRVSVIYVPYGISNELYQLEEFIPFKEIIEYPLYSLWLVRLNDMFQYLKYSKLWMILSIVGIVLLQIIFWIIGLNIYRKKIINNYKKLLYGCLYGLGMSLIGILSFMAFYWFVFVILFPFNQPVSIIVGLIGCLVCLLAIYKNAFYSIYNYIKINGIKYILKDLRNTLFRISKRYASFIRKNKQMLLFCILIITGFLLVGGVYSSGKYKRIELLSNLKLVTNQVKLSQLLDELESQYSSPLYGFFSDSLKIYRDKNRNDSTSIYCAVTRETLSKIAKENNLNIDITRILRKDIGVSSDGSKQCIRVADENIDKEYLIYYDLGLNIVDTIISLKYSNSNTNIIFSPNEDKVLFTVENRIYTYSIKHHKVDNEIWNLKYNINGLLMFDDNEFYVISGNTLYKGILGQPELIELNKENYVWYDNLIFLGKDKLAANSRFFRDVIIYDIENGTITTVSREDERVGSLVGVVTPDKLVTTKGYFNLHTNKFELFEDSISKKSILRNNILSLTLNKEGDSYIIKNAESGKIQNKLHVYTDDKFSTHFEITKDGNYLIAYGSDGIFMYALNDWVMKSVSITPRDKQMFDLK